MIIEWAVGAVLGWVWAVFDAIPDWELDLPGFGPLVGVMRLVDGIFPVSEILDFFIMAAQIAVVIFGIRLLVWLYEHLPFKGS